jgi:hypothetical protein
MAIINNSCNIKSQGITYCNGSGVFSGIDASTVGFVNTSNGTGVAPSFQAFTPTIATTWTAQSTGFTAAAANGYICTAALTVTLPASPSNGDAIQIVVDTTGSVVIQAGVLQFIRIDGNITIVGTATSTARGNAVSLVYNSSDLTWVAYSFITTWTLS